MVKKATVPKNLYAILWWTFTQILAYIGLALVLYSAISALTEPWHPLEKIAAVSSMFLTIFGVMVTALSIYVPRTTYYPPWDASRYVSAPAVIAMCCLAMFFLVRLGQLPTVLVNGFALIGLSGGLQRAIPTNPKLLDSLRHHGT